MPAILSIPSEIRALIYSHLLRAASPLAIVPIASDSAQSSAQAAVLSRNLSAQLLAAHSVFYEEALPILYGHNSFDISSRSAPSLLTSSPSSSNFSLIHSLILDWDQLQDFSFQLAKPSFRDLMTSLSVLETKHWRSRVNAQESAYLWRDVRSYERSICTAARAIVHKAPRLRIVAQREFVRPTTSRAEEIRRRNAERAAQQQQEETVPTMSATATPAGISAVTDVQPSPSQPNLPILSVSSLSSTPEAAMDSSHPSAQSDKPATMRVKWRFLAGVSQLHANESPVDIEGEVLALTLRTGNVNDEELGARQMALDPI